MDPLSAITDFYKYAGGVMEDLRKRDIADIDITFLDLKRQGMAEKMEELSKKLQGEITRKKAEADQDLTSRGLFNTTVRDSMHFGIERAAKEEEEKAQKENSRILEALALEERKINELTVTRLGRAWRWLKRRCR